MKNYRKITYIIVLFLLIFSCQKSDDNATSDTLGTILSETTTENAEITFTSLKIRGKVTSDGESEIINRGVCWSTQPNPTLSDELMMEESNAFTSTIENLTINTTYYFRVFVTNSIGTNYGEEQSFSTLDFSDTTWHFTTYYYEVGDYSIISEINFFADHTTRFDELDLPLQNPGYFITFGTWTLNGNELTYIWEGDDTNTSTYTYTGTISEMTMEGTFTHSSVPAGEGVWTAFNVE